MDSLKSLNNESWNLLHKHNLLRQLIEKEFTDDLISKIKLNDDLLDKLIVKFKEANNIDTDKSYEEWLKNNIINKTSLERNLINNQKLKIFCTENFESKCESYFLKRKKQLDTVVYSLIRVKSPYKAKEMYLRLIEKEAEFGDLSSMYSEGPEKQTRGIIGPIEIEKAHPNLIEILRSSKPKKINKPIQIGPWYLIVRVETYEPAILDSSRKSIMIQELFKDWINAQIDHIIKTTSFD